MKTIIAFPTIFIFAVMAFGQVNDDLPIPKETYSKDSKRIVKISGLLGVINNGEEVFKGKVARIIWRDKYDTVYFDIGKETFELNYSNISNVGRSYLKDLLKKNNRVIVNGYAGGSNGIWMVREISQK